MAENTYKKKPESTSLFTLLDKPLNMGAWLEKGSPAYYFPHLLFLAALGLVYITNAHYAESMVRKIQKMEVEVEKLRADYITQKTEYSRLSTYQQTLEKVLKSGLQEKEGKIQKIELKKGEY